MRELKLGEKLGYTQHLGGNPKKKTLQLKCAGITETGLAIFEK